MSEPQSQGVSYRKNLSFQSLKRNTKFGVVLVNEIFPLIIVIMFSMFLMMLTLETRVLDIVFACGGYVLTVCVACIAYLPRHSPRAAYTYGLITTFLCLICWTFLLGLSSAMVGMLAGLLMAFRRLGKMFGAESITNQNLSMFRFDSVWLIIVGLLFGITQPDVQGNAGEWFGEVFLLLLVCYALARLWSMWTLESIETGIRRNSRFGIYVMLAISVVIALWGPFALGHLLMVPFAVVAGASALVLGLLPPTFHLPTRHRPGTQPQIGAHMKNVPPSSHLSHVQLQTMTGIALAVVIVGLTLLLIRTRKRANRLDEEDLTEPAVATETAVRTWIKRGSESQFLTTRHPVRLRYQAMLKRLGRQGITMTPPETPRSFEERVPQGQEQGEAELRADYESVRYGPQPTDSVE